MSAPSLEVLAIQAWQLRNAADALRRHVRDYAEAIGDAALADDAAALVGVDLILASVAAGLRLASNPALRAETQAKLERDMAERRNRNLAAVAADPRA